ncbi:MAG: serine/threonine-protein kinase [Cyanobacteria bacterium KgW148]|nr:serine/threonine-protein kinase [Cyanobacteria bacterium KgW148]
MSYCVNPNCSSPQNPPDRDDTCAACGSNLKLRGRYVASRPLGKGGFGATFLANDYGLPGKPICVVKQLRPSTQSPSVMKMARELFEREAYTLGKIGNHPQIPRLLDYFEENGNFYLAQEYVEGETLKQELERHGPFSQEDIRKLLMEIMPALGFIHENGVIHRDIKPANIIRRKQDGKLVLIDFGAVSTQLNPAAADEDPSALLTNFAIGTPGFAPPEQMAMRPVYSSDIYAMAMTCLYLMTGRSPKDYGHDPRTGEINWKAQVKLSDDMMAIFDKMLQQSLSQRFRTAEEVTKAMASSPMSSISPSIRPTTSITGGSRPPIPGRGKITRAPVESTRSQDVSSQGMLSRAPDRNPAKELKGGRKIIVEYNHGKRNFANQDLAKASLASANLAGIVMSRAKLQETDFSHSDLTGASFQGSIMTQAKLSGANLTQAKLQRAILTKADLGGANLVNADLREANLQYAYMGKANLMGANLTGANLKGAYLTKANLKGANLSGADLKAAKVTDEQLATAKTNWSTIRPDGSKRLF